MDSCSKHLETGMSDHGFSLCGSLYGWLLVDEKCVFFSDAVLSLHAYLFLSPSLLSSHTDPPMDPVLLCHLLLRDCWEFLPIYLFLTAHSQSFSLESFLDSQNCPLLLKFSVPL